MVEAARVIVDPALTKGKFDRETTPLVRNSKLYEDIGVRILKVAFPIVDVAIWWQAKAREIRLRVQADEYDYLPVQGWWIDESGYPLRAELAPSGNGFQVNGHPYGFDRTWLCFPGWREYHDHESHQNVPWSFLRGNRHYRIPGLILQLKSDLDKQG